MAKTLAGSHISVQQDGQNGSPAEHPTPEQVTRQLRAILASPSFHGTKRGKQFLEYVCEKALNGEADSLKERKLAVEVFGRQPHSDLSEDTIVRVSAREVRRRLVQFYSTPEGHSASVILDLPSGSYAPEFRLAHVGSDPTPDAIEPETEGPGDAESVGASAIPEEMPLGLFSQAPTPVPATELPLATRRSSSVRFAGMALALILLSLAGWAMWPHQAYPAFVAFWRPVLQAGEPLMVAVGHPLVYHPSSRATRLNLERLPPTSVPMQRPLQLAPKELDGSDMVPVFNQYVGFGDLVASTEVATMLGREAKSVRVRMASSIQFADMRTAPTLLIGAVTNRWTMELQRNWRFQFTRKENTIAIEDTGDKTRAAGEGQSWSVTAKDDGSVTDDYFLIGRLQSSSSAGMVLMAAGLKQFGTEAGGQLLSDPEQLTAILAKVGPGWEDKNLQVVLHTKVIGNAPTQSEVVAWHVW